MTKRGHQHSVTGDPGSLPSVGGNVLAALLAETYNPRLRRDHHVPWCLSGVAPVSKRSGKSLSVVWRLAAHNRLRCDMHLRAAIAVQHDAIGKAKYLALRACGHGNARALWFVADRLLAVACTMLEYGTSFNPELTGQNQTA